MLTLHTMLAFLEAACGLKAGEEEKKDPDLEAARKIFFDNKEKRT